MEIIKEIDEYLKNNLSQKRYIHSVGVMNKAKELANKLKIDLDISSLCKQKDIIEQSKLSKEERVENIKGAYILQKQNYIQNENILKDKKIILIDDVFTTGSTANECCRVLKQANPKRIDVLTIAKD